MSAVTLETLHAEAIALISKAKQFLAVDGATHNAHPLNEYVEELRAALEQASMAYAVWEIAERHGLKAAMLYKLSDGAIDPRNTDA
ncbi:hypothetical protein [Sphingomonas paucimobilis]|uniref:hypothetical protein n=1 Tax=Sphingomonas paucimobilis TaxID=13689 RepID=UPI0031DABF68